jgi:hypothetical protein
VAQTTPKTKTYMTEIESPSTDLTPELASDPHKPCPKCNWRLGEYPTTRALQTHNARKHTKGWSTHGNFKGKRKKKYPSDSPAYRKAKYEMSKVSAKARTNISKAQSLRRALEKGQVLTNGTSPIPGDNIGESARAIILAAQVLRSVSVGLKL